MRIIGCDLHARQQTLTMLDTTTGEVVELTVQHEGDHVREFYSSLPRPVRVGIEATGSMQWFLNLIEDVMRLWRTTRHENRVQLAASSRRVSLCYKHRWKRLLEGRSSL